MFVDKYIVMLAVCQFIRHIIEACYGKPVKVENVTSWSRACHEKRKKKRLTLKRHSF